MWLVADIEFKGQSFTLTDEVSEFALLEFADAAAAGQDGDTLQGMASMLRLVRECIAPDEWARFRALASTEKAKVADLLPIIQTAMSGAAERPTGQPSDSSDGLTSTPQRSESTPDAPVTDRLSGRPDLQLMVAAEREAKALAG